MRIAVLLAEADPSAWERADAAARQAVFEAHAAFDAAVRERGRIVGGEALAGVEQARTVRSGPDRTVTEGPYAETAEQLTGFYLVELPDLDTAVALAALLPAGYTVELRPVVDVPES